LPLGVKALGVNCGPAHTLAKPLAELRAICGPDFPLIAYGNIGHADEAQGWINTDAVDPDSYVQHAKTWPAQIVGGCCGTTPEHIRKLRVGRNGPQSKSTTPFGLTE
jgi:5-methyltetrahydrofolate--homocysteine methyltransferase